MVHRVVVVLNEVKDVDEPVRDPPVNAAQIASCQIASELDRFDRHFGPLLCLLDHVFGCGSQFDFFLLVRFHQLHVFEIGVDAIEDFAVVVGEMHVQNFLVDA